MKLISKILVALMVVAYLVGSAMPVMAVAASSTVVMDGHCGGGTCPLPPDGGNDGGNDGGCSGGSCDLPGNGK